MTANRIALLKKEMESRSLDGLLVTNPANITYLSGFQGHDSVLLFTRRKDYFFTDSRYIEEAEKNVVGFQIRLVRKSTYETLRATSAGRMPKKMGFEAMDLPYGVAMKLKQLLPKTELVPIEGLIAGPRAVKDKDEIAKIRASARLTKAVLGRAHQMLKPGVTEAALKNDIDTEFIRSGAKSAYETIVASGTNSSMPHAKAGPRRILKNDFVMIDLGCVLNGYCSDITRMFTLGRVSSKYRKIRDIVHEAHDLAINGIKPGVLIASIDFIARNHIKHKGYGQFFGHSLGHGVGLEVHESPSISGRTDGQIREGMVFTVEPAIYIPGFGGVRIEDMVLVTNTGHEVLTR